MDFGIHHKNTLAFSMQGYAQICSDTQGDVSDTDDYGQRSMLRLGHSMALMRIAVEGSTS